MTSDHGTAVAVATAMETEIGKIASLIERASEEPTPLEREIQWLGQMLGIVVVVLSAIMSVVLAMGVQRMAKRNAVVKQLSSVETLGAGEDGRWEVLGEPTEVAFLVAEQTPMTLADPEPGHGPHSCDHWCVRGIEMSEVNL